MTDYLCARLHREVKSPCKSCPRPSACQFQLPKGIRAGTPVKASDGPSLVTVRDVPIVMAGVEYQLASGPATFTPEDIMDFVASQDDPAVVPPRLKIGHESILSTNKAMGILKNGDDGVPALGKFVNIRFDSASITAVGDAVGVPRWLAEIMPIAYPNRSIEGFQGALTNSGHVWGLVVHAVALLGVVWPGCSTLDDLPLLYTEAGPDDIEVTDENGEEVDVGAILAAAVVARRPAASNAPVTASVNVDDVRRAYYESLNADQMWWWIRAIYLDPNELIVMDDDSGDLFRVPFTSSGDTVEFSDPQKVKIQYVDAAASQIRAQAQIDMAGRQVALFASRAESRPDVTNEGGSMTPDQIRALRARLGLSEQQLPDNATQAQVNAALGVTAEAPTPPAPTPDPAPTEGDPAPSGDPADGEEEPSGTPPNEQTQTSGQPAEAPAPGEPAQAGLPEGMVAVPATAWAEVQRNAAAGAQVAATAAQQEQENIIATALREGRIRPGDVQSYRNMFANAASAPVARTLLTASVEQGGLMAGLVPVSERGELPQGDATTAAANDTGYDRGWLTPGEQQRIDQVKAGTYQPPAVSGDDTFRQNGNGQPAAAGR
jgi:hypothetical protein